MERNFYVYDCNATRTARSKVIKLQNIAHSVQLLMMLPHAPDTVSFTSLHHDRSWGVELELAQLPVYEDLFGWRVEEYRVHH